MKCSLCGRTHDTITVKVDVSEIEELIEKLRNEEGNRVEEWVKAHKKGE